VKGLNKFSREFGIKFSKKKIVDSEHHEGGQIDHVVIHNFANHPVTRDLKIIFFSNYGGMPIATSNADAQHLAFTDEDANPPNQPVLVTVSYGKGVIVAFSCSSSFLDDGIKKYDNLKLAKEIVRFMRNPVGIFESSSREEQITTQTSTVEQILEILPFKVMNTFDVVGHVKDVISRGVSGKDYLSRVRRYLTHLGISHCFFIETGEEKLLTTQRAGVFTRKTTYLKIRGRKPIVFGDERMNELGEYVVTFRGTKDKYYGKLYYTGRRFILLISKELLPRWPEFRPAMSLHRTKSNWSLLKKG